MALSSYFPPSRLGPMREYLAAFAARFGIRDMRTNDWLPNTRRALAMAEYARDEGRLDDFRAAAMDAYWRLGHSLEDDTSLREIAAQAGLDRGLALVAADQRAYLRRVDDTRAEADEQGVTGVPTLFLGGEVVVGCQPYEVIAEAARRAGARSRA